jgi:hypothetical protein
MLEKTVVSFHRTIHNYNVLKVKVAEVEDIFFREFLGFSLVHIFWLPGAYMDDRTVRVIEVP